MFEPASKIAKEKGLVVKGSSCHMCGQPSEPICWECLVCTIETAVERMAHEGKLDDVVMRVVERMRGGA